MRTAKQISIIQIRSVGQNKWQMADHKRKWGESRKENPKKRHIPLHLKKKCILHFNIAPFFMFTEHALTLTNLNPCITMRKYVL